MSKGDMDGRWVKDGWKMHKRSKWKINPWWKMGGMF
jgi:hypothetical protein